VADRDHLCLFAPSINLKRAPKLRGCVRQIFIVAALACLNQHFTSLLPMGPKLPLLGQQFHEGDGVGQRLQNAAIMQRD
jgi:hypothetical protein